MPEKPATAGKPDRAEELAEEIHATYFSDGGGLARIEIIRRALQEARTEALDEAANMLSGTIVNRWPRQTSNPVPAALREAVVAIEKLKERVE